MSDANELPKGWCWESLSAITSHSMNGFGKRRSDSGTASIVLRLADIDDGRISLSSTRRIGATAEEIERYALLPGDLIVIRVNGSPDLVGRMVRFTTSDEQLLFCDHFIRLRLIHTDMTSFVRYFADTGLVRKFVEQNKVSSAGQNTISQGTLDRLTIPVAPLAEQRRIVAKIEELFSDLDAGVAALKRAKANLKRYRAAVLKAAVEGKLTEEWRAKHPAKEPASALLARILKERHLKWEADQLAKFASAKKEPPKNWKDKYIESTPPDTTSLPELPNGWIWATLPQLGLVDRGRSRNRPRNAPHLYGGPYPFVQTGDIRHADTFVRTYDQTYSEAGLQQSKLWPAGTLCITIAANIAETAILGFDGCFPDSVVGFIPISEDVSVRFVELFFRTIQQRLEAFAPATAQKNLNLESLNQVAICLPPTDEQRQFVSEVDERLSIVRVAEALIEVNELRASRLRQSILKQAFEGKLVPQDPKDEPASVLLERLRASRAHDEANGTAATSKRTRAKINESSGEPRTRSRRGPSSQNQQEE